MEGALVEGQRQDGRLALKLGRGHTDLGEYRACVMLPSCPRLLRLSRA